MCDPYQPTDEQIDDLAAAVGRQVFQKLGVPASADTRYLAIRIAGSDAMQAIIRAAQDQREREVALRIRDAVDTWEASGDDEALVNDVLDPWTTSATAKEAADV